MTNEEAVEAGIAAYARAEQALRDAHDALLELPAVYSAIAENGIEPLPAGATAFGYFEGETRGNAARQMAASIATVMQGVIDMHSGDTTRAQGLGIDLVMRGGGR